MSLSYGGFHKLWYPWFLHFRFGYIWIFPSKPSVWGYPHDYGNLHITGIHIYIYIYYMVIYYMVHIIYIYIYMCIYIYTTCILHGNIYGNFHIYISHVAASRLWGLPAGRTTSSCPQLYKRRSPVGKKDGEHVEVSKKGDTQKWLVYKAKSHMGNSWNGVFF